VVAKPGSVSDIPSPPAVNAHEYVNGPTPPTGVAVVVFVVTGDPGHAAAQAVGDAPTENPPERAMLTEMSTVVVDSAASVTVQRSVPVRVSGDASPVAVSVVATVVVESIVIPDPPAFHVHA